MSTSVVLPALGESVTEGTVTRWLKQVGDTVQADEGLLEISTDKVDTEIPSPVTGVLEKIHFSEDDTVEVGAVLATINEGGEASTEASPSESAPAESEQEPEPEPEPESTASEDGAQPAAEQAPAAATTTAGDSAGREVTLPELGESVTEGTVTRWLKQMGDSVEVDEALLEISTDKVDTEIPSPVAGVLQEILVAEDETVAVGAALARIGDAASTESPAPSQPAPAETPNEQEAATDAEAPADAAASVDVTDEAEGAAAIETEAPAHAEAHAAATSTVAAPQQPAASDSAHTGDASTAEDQVTYVTPLVRKLAQEKGVQLSSLTGSGVGGRIRKEDVLKAATAPKAGAVPAEAAPQAPPVVEVSPLRGTTQPMSRLRKVLAERAVASMQSTAQLTTVVEVDVTALATYRDQVKADFLAATGDKLSFLPFFALAAAEALQANPVINATVEDNQIVYPATENISIAVDTERGLLTPVLRDTAAKNIAEIAHEIADLAARTRANKLKPDELSGGTFTLTNTGSRGALFDTPVVFLPQSAILGTGVVVKKPGVVTIDGNDALTVRSYVYLALSYDHRIIDGADAAGFLGAVKKRLEAAQFHSQLGI